MSGISKARLVLAFLLKELKMKYNFVYTYKGSNNELLFARQIFTVNAKITQDFLLDIEDWIKDHDQDIPIGSNPVIVNYQKLEEE